MTQFTQMSEIEFVNTLDSTAKVLNAAWAKPKYECPVPWRDCNYLQASTQTASSSGTQYTFTLQENQVLGSVMYEEITFGVLVNYSVSAVGPGLGRIADIIPRFMPIESATQNCQITINGAVVNGPQSYECITPLLSFNKTPEMDNQDLSAYSSMLDTFAGQYNPPATTVGIAAAGPPIIILGEPVSADGIQQYSAKSPFNSYYSSSYGYTGRSAGVQFIQSTVPFAVAGVIPVNATTQYIYTMTCRQPIFTGLTPMTEHGHTGYTGIVNNVQVQRTFVTNIAARLVSTMASYGTNVTFIDAVGIQPLVNSSAKLYYQVYTPDPMFKVPKATYYNYIDYEIFNNQSTADVSAPSAAIALGALGGPLGPIPATQQVVVQAINISHIPLAIYVWASRIQASNKRSIDSDAPGFAFTKLSLDFGNRSGQFSSMNQFQIYQEFCAKHGFVKSYAETTGITYYTGGVATPVQGNIPTYGQVLRIDGSQLTGFGPEFTAGSNFPTQLRITATVQPTSSAYSGSVFMNVLVVNQAIFKIDHDGTAQVIRGVIGQDDLMTVRKKAEYKTQYKHMLAGSFWGDLWSGVKQVPAFAWDHKGDIMSAAKTIMPLVGLGRKKQSHKKRHIRGRGFSGGAVLDLDDDECDSDCDCDQDSEIRSIMRGGSISNKSRVKFM